VLAAATCCPTSVTENAQSFSAVFAQRCDPSGPRVAPYAAVVGRVDHRIARPTMLPPGEGPTVIAESAGPLRLIAPDVLTQDDDDTWYSPGVVDLSGGRIVHVGPVEGAPEAPAGARSVHLRGALLPGLVDAHAHTPMTLLRGAGEGLPVGRWLTDVMWPREARLTGEDVETGMRAGAIQLLTGGVTTTAEMYFHPDRVAAGAVSAGLRCIIAPPILVVEGLQDVMGTWQEQLDEALAFADRHRDSALVDGALGPHAPYSVPTETLRAVGAAAAEHDLLIQIHLAEQRDEDAAIRAQHGVSATRLLDDLGMLEARTIAAHGVWLGPDDIALLAARGAGVAHCPCSNGKHASGIAPVTDLRAAGVPVGIATDGPASHDRLDIFEELRTALRLARIRAGDASALSARDALAMVTREAARALGRDDLGVLEVGRRADLIHLDTTDPDLAPVAEREDLRTNLVWSGSPRLVRDVWVEGVHVVQDGEHVDRDAVALAADITARARRIATP